MNPARDRVAAWYQSFAENECKGYSPLYHELSHFVASDNELIEFIAAMPNQQPNLFFASVHYLTGHEDFPISGADLKRFVNGNRPEITTLMVSRRTQTNEIGRCAALIAALPMGPLALVEVGASAGLCLMLDRFRYDYGQAKVGDESSPVLIRCALQGASVPRLALPDVVWRRGLDIDPIDLKDSQRVRWLMACIWPDHVERRERLRAAVEMCREQAPLVQFGDLVDDLSSTLASAPMDATLVVFHSAVLPYVDPERRLAFATVLTEFSKKREIVWVSNEGRGVLPKIDALGRPIERFQVALTIVRDGEMNSTLIAIAHAHGAELEWLD